MTIRGHYHNEKQRFLENCTQCGLCAEECPILPYTDISKIPSQEIQQGVFDFLDGGNPNQHAYTKAFACMVCFKCTIDMCPEDLNPMMINEFIKGEYIAKGLANKAYSDFRRPDSTHRVVASLQVSESEYSRITTPGGNPRARYVFFPGCNVYFQPENILNALDIMDAIGDEYAFLPGIDNCCGDSHLFLGDIDVGTKRAEELVAAITNYQPEAAVFWCATCQCHFENSIVPALDFPFNVVSFPQYLAANMNKLQPSDASAGTVTLHEACKSAFTGLDPNGPREVLQQLPGVTLREMKHHGQDTCCCGSGAICWFPKSCAQLREDRLKEAEQTGAERLVTVCHHCNQVFSAEEPNYDFSVTNYLNLVAEAIGINRKDKFKKYMLWGSLERILKDADEHIAESPFENERIVEVLKEVFIRQKF